MKLCSKCKIFLSIENFFKDSSRKDGLSYICKDCQRLKDKRRSGEKIRQSNKKYKAENELKVKEQQAEYYKKNKNSILSKKKEYYKFHKDDLALYDVYAEKISKYENVRRCPEDKKLLQVQCIYDNIWFVPKVTEVKSRIAAINNIGTGYGECRFYCSDACKHACPIYRVRIDSRKKENTTSREVQPELRKMVLERDNWTCQKCNKNKFDFSDLELHCHHIFPLNEDPIRSADVDNCITLCKECHKHIHKTVADCSYGKLRCSN